MSWCPECGAEYREGHVECSECHAALVDAPPSSGQRPGEELVEIAAYATLEQAELAQGLLLSTGIATAVEDARVPHSELGNVGDGEVALLVPAAHAEQARELLAEAERGELAVTDDAVPDEVPAPEPTPGAER